MLVVFREKTAKNNFANQVSIIKSLKIKREILIGIRYQIRRGEEKEKMGLKKRGNNTLKNMRACMWVFMCVHARDVSFFFNLKSTHSNQSFMCYA